MTADQDAAKSFTWRALQQALPDGRVRLEVIGRCDRPSAAWRVSLSRAPFQPSNANVLLLRFTGAPIGGGSARQLMPLTVAYEETSLRRYKLVSIEPGGIGVAIEDQG